MKLFVRAAREEDARSIIELLNPIIRAGTYTIMDEEISLKDQLEYMRGLSDRGVFNVAIDNDSGNIVGIQSVDQLSPEIRTFSHVGDISTFVRLGFHGQGIGGNLCRAMFQGASQSGFRKITATIRADNPRAVSFYQGQGFHIVGTARHHACVRGVYIDEVIAETLIE